MRLALLALLLTGAAAPAVAAPARMEAPADLGVADPAPVRLSGLRPNEEVELVSTRRSRTDFSFDPTPRTFVARARFRADVRGRLDLATAAPVSGDYAGADKAGLFWSAKAARAPETADPAAGRVRVEAHRADGAVLTAEARTEPDLAEIVVEPVAGFPGAVFAHPRGAGRRPSLIVLGGSEGGSGTAKAFAPRFAARGYAVLGLPYYDPGWNPADRLPDLPHAFVEIPVDRLAAVRDWLAGRPEVDASRIGVWGASKGAEFALLAATRYPWIKAVAAIVPTDVVWEGWGRPGPAGASFAWRGEGLAFQRYDGMEAELAKAARREPMNLRRVHDAGRRSHAEDHDAARIPVERYAGPLVLAGGGDDRVWPSADMAQAVAETRRKSGRPTVLVVEPHAGHGLGGTGYDPAAPLSAVGGEPAANARARRLAWKATLETFAAALHPERVGAAPGARLAAAARPF